MALASFPARQGQQRSFARTFHVFSRLGRITNFDYFPETTQGDFFSLKDVHQGGQVLAAWLCWRLVTSVANAATARANSSGRSA